MAGAFTLPSIVAKELQLFSGMDLPTCERIAQLSVPLLVQIVGTPLHIMGLGYYNHKEYTFKEHVAYMRKIYLNTLALRMMRFLPAYGIGGICNIELRRWGKSQVPY